MTDPSPLAAALSQAEHDSRTELANRPQAATGSCTISSSGYSECKSGITKDACDKQKADGFKVTWVENGSC